MFDEADALSDKRADARDVNDHFANVGVPYLHQRLETLRGIVVLTMNLSHNVDDAFTHRLGSGIDFPLPDTNEREEIWMRRSSAPI